MTTQPKTCQCPACLIVPHASDCAVHAAPAYPIGKCDCGATATQPKVTGDEGTSRPLEIPEGAGDPDDWRWAKLLTRTYDMAIDPELADFLRKLLMEIASLDRKTARHD